MTEWLCPQTAIYVCEYVWDEHSTRCHGRVHCTSLPGGKLNRTSTHTDETQMNVDKNTNTLKGCVNMKPDKLANFSSIIYVLLLQIKQIALENILKNVTSSYSNIHRQL